MKSPAFILALLITSPLLAQDTPAGFLPLTKEHATFSGAHWNDEWGGGDRPLDATVSVEKAGEGAWGTAVEVRVACSDKKRKITPMQWIITKEDAIYDVWFGEADADLKKWIAGTAKPDLSVGNLRVPATNQESGGEFIVPDKPLSPRDGSDPVNASSHSYLWAERPWETEIRLNPTRDTVRYRASHGSGHFTTIVLQRGVGIVRLAMGSGARKDGWELHRHFAPEPAAKTSKPAAAPDIAQLMAMLPREAMPKMGALAVMAEPKARAELVAAARDRDALNAVSQRLHVRSIEIDATNGWFSLSSDGDGEGETFQAAVWKRADGSKLLGLHLLNWTAGPSATRDARLFEYRDGRFRAATFSEWNLPEPGDFFREPTAGQQRGPFIAGDWIFPRRGTTISIRPPLEDDADMLGPETTSEEDNCFELLWDGKNLSASRCRVASPRPAPNPRSGPSKASKVRITRTAATRCF